MSYGVTAEGFVGKRLDVILEEKKSLLRSVFGDSLDLSPQSPDGQLAGLMAQTEYMLWGLTEAVYNSFNPNAAVGATLDNICAINGIVRLEATHSTVELTATGADGTIIPTGAQFQSTAGDVFEVYSGGEISGGTATVQAQAVEAGPIAAAIGSITTIVNPIFGLDSITNLAEATVGTDRETDAALRIRRSRSVSFPSTSMVDSIYSAVANVDGVERAVVIENDTDSTLGSGQTPHSVRVIVQGGADQDVAEAIFQEKAAGIEAYGDDIISVEDSQGVSHDIGITRPTPVSVYIDILLTTFSDFPADGEDLIRQAIIDYAAENFNLGDDVVYSRLFTPINSVPGHQVDHLWISLSDPPTGADVNTLTIADDEVASFDAADIDIA